MLYALRSSDGQTVTLGPFSTVSAIPLGYLQDYRAAGVLAACRVVSRATLPMAVSVCTKTPKRAGDPVLKGCFVGDGPRGLRVEVLNDRGDMARKMGIQRR